MDGVKKVFGDNGLSISLFSLFVVCLLAQAATGVSAYNDALKQAHLGQVSFNQYLTTGTFLDGIFSNWQAAILQLAVLIGFSSILRQRGAAHSRKGGDEKAEGSGEDRSAEKKLKAFEDERERRRKDFGRVRKLSNLYKNSLSLTFVVFFVLLFAIYAFTGWRLYNENQAIAHLQPEAFGAYFASSEFWFTVFQCWEAEFFAIGFYIVASIFLRQEGSPESKKTDSGDGDTGDTND